MDQVIDDRKNFSRKRSSRLARTEVEKHVPRDLLLKATVLLQDTGYITISPRDLARSDWRRLNEKVKRMGGLWISNNRFSHWSIPFTRTTE